MSYDYDLSQMIDDWKGAISYRDLLLLNKSFIMGKTSSTWYYCGPLEKDSQEISASLLRMHDHGLFTDDGQVGLLKKSVSIQECHRGSHSESNKHRVDIEQKSYVGFFMPLTTMHLEAAQSLFNRPTQYKVGITFFGSTSDFNTLMSGFDSPHVNTNAKTACNYESEPYCVTRSRCYVMDEQIPSWEDNLYLSTPSTSSTKRLDILEALGLSNVLALLSSNTVYVEVALPDWNDVQLEERIIATMQIFGVKADFNNTSS